MKAGIPSTHLDKEILHCLLRPPKVRQVLKTYSINVVVNGVDGRILVAMEARLLCPVALRFLEKLLEVDVVGKRYHVAERSATARRSSCRRGQRSRH